MKILLIGSGGREHALAWKLSQSEKVEHIYCVPGNPGMATVPKCENVALDTADLNCLADFAEKNNVELTVVGPEVPLVAGIADVFEARGLAVFGPKKLAAQLEGSKSFSKQLMAKYHIPTAFFKVCNTAAEAKEFVRMKGVPIVVKADGLAAGKGVVVAMTMEEAFDAVDMMMGDKKFGAAGARVVVEEFMEGEEASLLAFTDGKTVVPMIAAQDHKRVYDGDKGPNTGGMGAYAPAPVMTDALKRIATETILKPVVNALQAERMPYKGCLYAGLMINGNSVKVVEFNCRFGDPETQAVLPLLDSDLAEIMLACTNGTLKSDMVRWKDEAAVCVVMASGGYPEKYDNGKQITGLNDAKSILDTVVFHAGTKNIGDIVVTNGGRVLGVTAVRKTIAAAQQAAYETVDKIDFAGKYFRKDIAWRALKR
ncbi:MAG: phosphoribosylamine--glycine ligase [Phascolarctobacterium sp.]|nr:phosphoribosylamine--glycine ligase [Candidatus Phascolarctobacterium caballi]